MGEPWKECWAGWPPAKRLSQSGFLTVPDTWAFGGGEEAAPAIPVSSLYEPGL